MRSGRWSSGRAAAASTSARVSGRRASSSAASAATSAGSIWPGSVDGWRRSAVMAQLRPDLRPRLLLTAGDRDLRAPLLGVDRAAVVAERLHEVDVVEVPLEDHGRDPDRDHRVVGAAGVTPPPIRVVVAVHGRSVALRAEELDRTGFAVAPGEDDGVGA